MENDRQVEVVAQGFVLLRSALSPEQQKWLARVAMAAGCPPERGFWQADDTAADGRKLNATRTRGRIYDALETYPEHDQLIALCQDLVVTARLHDPALPAMEPTHLLLLCYTSANGMYWHADTGENDGDNDHPIVSFSIGNQCKFGYVVEDGKREYTVLASGDVAIWGGPLRMMKHCVKKVNSRTSPDFLSEVEPIGQDGERLPLNLADLRFNFTFRDAPTVRGREKEFERFDPYRDTKKERASPRNHERSEKSFVGTSQNFKE